ncbi:hypothetical protein [Sulfurirhabdus autotrophica]|uniref:Uncharacterized protein n=1 Tax=Sulfurirhabdus autotrophica TaxID=1706046 RepID=A0A4R3XRR1_9PROT|nr:hypothetical protein [Sulfurirhabdus autotrophica]TCV79184.1 hypothetical protein EDC63_1346 [Sulfurirhabdus autotrophica]
MNTLLLIAAAGLGFLSFFEPCTIATHSLFALRASRDTTRNRWRALAQLVASRTILLAAIFGIAAWIGLKELSAISAMIILGVIGTIYLVSRKIYLPVPHIEFFRVLPGHTRLAQGLKLGLTLPACTLPLVVVTGVISALTQQPGMAILAGIVFAIMFSLPTLWDSVRGFDTAHREFLSKAATTIPYLTALLLWSGAFLIWQIGS